MHSAIKFLTLSLTISVFNFIIFPFNGFTRDNPTNAGSVTGGSNPYIVNIDDPSFRKLVVALPKISVDPKDDSELNDFAQRMGEDLKKYFEFTRLFTVMNPQAYEGVKPASSGTTGPSLLGFEGIDLLQWKNLQVENLTTGSLQRLSKTGIKLELKTADINKGVVVLNRSYTVKNYNEIYETLKMYMDYLLVAYTGKKGIFTTKIAFIGRRTEKSEKQLFMSDIDGRNLVQLTHEPAPHVSPAWSPDGQSIAYTSFEQKNPDLFMINPLVKPHKKQLIAGYKTGLNSGGVFSPFDNGLIIFSAATSGKTDIYSTSVPYKTREILIKSPGMSVDPTISPDGDWLAFVSDRFSASSPHIFKVKLDWDATKNKVKTSGPEIRLTFNDRGYNATPAWSPDGKKIAFAGYDREIYRFDLFLMNTDGTQMERLTLKTGDNESPQWSPNGRLILYHSNRVGQKDSKGPAQLYMMNPDGSDQQMIDTGLHEAQSPSWGPYTLK